LIQDLKDLHVRFVEEAMIMNPNAKYSEKKRIEYKEQFTDPNEPISFK